MIAVYIRTSTEEQNPENQLKDCNSINIYEQATVFMDKQSAWKDNIERDKFNELKKLIKNKKVKHLIVWDWDRIYRNRQKLKEFFRLCSIFGCKIHSFRQQWYEKLNDIPNPFNEIMQEFFLNMLGWLAEEESQKKSDRVKMAVRKKGNKAYSYKGNKWGRKGISTQKKNKIRQLYGPNMSIRAIASDIGLSVGVVHKYIQEINREKEEKRGVHQLVN